MLLVLDVGNTNTTMGVYEGDKLLRHWRLTSKKQTVDEIGYMMHGLLGAFSIDKKRITGAVYGSVVPPLDDIFIQGVESYIGVKCMKVTSKLVCGLKIAMRNPTGIGADRLANAVAGIEKYGAPLIVVDLGTAITLDVISRDSEYLGGTISPGMELGMEALFNGTAKLPKISLVPPTRHIGGNTIEALQSGIVYGAIGMVDALIAGVQKELGYDCQVIATGGHSRIFTQCSALVKKCDPWLTLDGLKLIYDRNVKK